VNFERITVFEGRYNCICLSGEDISKIARILARHAENEGGRIKASVESADGKDIFTSHDPDFFLCDDMPEEVRLISIKNSNYAASTRFDLTFDASNYKPVMLSVKGDRSETYRLFYDLEKEIVAKQTFGYWVLDIVDKFWFGFGLSGLFAIAIFLTFDFFLTYWSAIFPEFRGSAAHIGAQRIGWSTILVMIMTGVFWIPKSIKKLIPPIQFFGRISDPYAKSRKIRIWAFSAIFLPITISLITLFFLD